MSIQFKDGIWYAVVYYRDEFGKQKYKWFPAEGKQAAKNLEREKRTDMQRGEVIITSKTPLRKFLDEWLEVEISQKRPRTRGNYKLQADNLCRNLGDAQIGKLTPLTIQKHLNSEIKRGLKPTSVQYQYAVLNQALQKAVIWRFIAKNPCDAVDSPKRNEPNNAAWTLQQAETFLNYIKDTRMYLVGLLGLLCGLRREEILGLRWQDIDLKNKCAFIQHGLSRDPETHKLELGGLKTQKSKDFIGLPAPVIEVLSFERKAQMVEAARKNYYDNQNYVVCKPDGKPYDPSYVTHAIPKLIRRYNKEHKDQLPIIRVHDMRHTYVTVLYELGLDDKAVSEAARHARTVFTSDYYVHLRREVQHRPAELINANFTTSLGKH